MGILKIKCMNCGASNVIPPDIIYPLPLANAHPNRCPHCLAEMDERLWKKAAEAFWTIEEVNKDLRSAAENGADLLQISYSTHYADPNKIKI